MYTSVASVEHVILYTTLILALALPDHSLNRGKYMNATYFKTF